jgi:hypothetical protein
VGLKIMLAKLATKVVNELGGRKVRMATTRWQLTLLVSVELLLLKSRGRLQKAVVWRSERRAAQWVY